MISPNHSVWHSQWGRGDIKPDNADYYEIRYRSREFRCHYVMRLNSPNELSAIRADNLDVPECDLGELRRVPGSQIFPQAPATGGSGSLKSGSDAGIAGHSPAGKEQSSKATADSGAPGGSPPASKDQAGKAATTETGSATSDAAAQPAAGKPPVKVKAGDILQDCPACPEVAVLPEGTFTMGSLGSEPGRGSNEGPMHLVVIKPVAIGIYPVTRGQFSAFVAETGYRYPESCIVRSAKAGAKGKDRYPDRAGYSYLNPGFAQDDTHPAVCVSWYDALAYVGWLSKKTGKEYRLPSEAEREYAARAGTSTPYSFGFSISHAIANYDQDASVDGLEPSGRGTLPARSFQPNAFGLYQMHGNVAEWTQDCWNASYAGAPVSGAAIPAGDCNKRVLRGGGFGYSPPGLRSAYREAALAGERWFHLGFRVARAVEN